MKRVLLFLSFFCLIGLGVNAPVWASCDCTASYDSDCEYSYIPAVGTCQPTLNSTTAVFAYPNFNLSHNSFELVVGPSRLVCPLSNIGRNIKGYPLEDMKQIKFYGSCVKEGGCDGEDNMIVWVYGNSIQRSSQTFKGGCILDIDSGASPDHDDCAVYYSSGFGKTIGYAAVDFRNATSGRRFHTIRLCWDTD